METRTMTPADIILLQLGGRKFITMTGSKNFYSTDKGNTLSMHLTKNKSTAKYLQITLNERDTYTMLFTKFGGKNSLEMLIEVEKIENVYADMLQRNFTQITGLDTTL